MKKRIGTKIYDTEKGISVLPELGLYKQPKNRTFYLFDGEKITPISYDEAENMVRGAGREDLLSNLFHRKADYRGCSNVQISIEHTEKLSAYSRKVGKSMKSIIEAYIDSLSVEK